MSKRPRQDNYIYITVPDKHNAMHGFVRLLVCGFSKLAGNPAKLSFAPLSIIHSYKTAMLIFCLSACLVCLISSFITPPDGKSANEAVLPRHDKQQERSQPENNNQPDVIHQDINNAPLEPLQPGKGNNYYPQNEDHPWKDSLTAILLKNDINADNMLTTYYNTNTRDAASDIDILARMIHAETHHEGYLGKIAAGQCAYDRWQNTTVLPGQKYCWNPGGIYSLGEIILQSNQFAVAVNYYGCSECLMAAGDVISGVRAFPSHVVTYFRRHDMSNDWVSTPYLGHVESHAFYGWERPHTDE